MAWKEGPVLLLLVALASYTVAEKSTFELATGHTCSVVQAPLAQYSVGLQIALLNLTTIACTDDILGNLVTLQGPLVSQPSSAIQSFQYLPTKIKTTDFVNNITYYNFLYSTRGYQNMWLSTPAQITATFSYASGEGSKTLQATTMWSTQWPAADPSTVSTIVATSTVGASLDVCYSCAVSVFADVADAVANPTTVASNASSPGLQQLVLTATNAFNQSLYMPQLSLTGVFVLSNTSAPFVMSDIPAWINFTSSYTWLMFTLWPTPAEDGSYVLFQLSLADSLNYFGPQYFVVQIVPQYPFWGTHIAHWFWLFPALLFLCIFSVAVLQVRSGCVRKDDTGSPEQYSDRLLEDSDDR